MLREKGVKFFKATLQMACGLLAIQGLAIRFGPWSLLAVLAWFCVGFFSIIVVAVRSGNVRWQKIVCVSFDGGLYLIFAVGAFYGAQYFLHGWLNALLVAVVTLAAMIWFHGPLGSWDIAAIKAKARLDAEASK